MDRTIPWSQGVFILVEKTETILSVCFMVVSDRKYFQARKWGVGVKDVCFFTLRKKRAVRPEGALQKLKGRAFQEESSSCVAFKSVLN